MSRLTGFSPLVRKQIKDRAGHEDPYTCCEGCGYWYVEAEIELHHRRPRGAGGSRREDTNLAANGICSCRKCHAAAESDRTEAYARGWLISNHRKGITPQEVAVEMHDGTFLLDNEGNKYSIPNPNRETA